MQQKHVCFSQEREGGMEAPKKLIIIIIVDRFSSGEGKMDVARGARGEPSSRAAAAAVTLHRNVRVRASVRRDT